MRKKGLLVRLHERIFDYSAKPFFISDDVYIGKGCSIGRNVKFHCKKVVLGDGISIGDDVTFNCDNLKIGDFATIYPKCFFPGPGNLEIGHNFWLGTQSIIDSQGNTYIGNNVGIGAQSQLWTHMKFGDVAAGCRFHSKRELIIEDDVWLVGHILVSPVRIGARSLVMLGSVITSDIPADCIYAGHPAVNMTHKFGSQFRDTSNEERHLYVTELINAIALQENIEEVWSRVNLVDSYTSSYSSDELVINISERTYLKRGNKFERLIIKSLLPNAKYLPTKLDV